MIRRMESIATDKPRGRQQTIEFLSLTPGMRVKIAKRHILVRELTFSFLLIPSHI